MPNPPAANTAPARIAPDSLSHALDAQSFQRLTLFLTDQGWQASVSVEDISAWHVCVEPTPMAALCAAFKIPVPHERLVMFENIVGLTVTNVHTGYNASVSFKEDEWSPHEFGTTAADAIRKCIRLHRPARPVLAPPPY